MINPNTEEFVHKLISKINQLEIAVSILVKISEQQNKAIEGLIANQPKTANQIYQSDVAELKKATIHYNPIPAGGIAGNVH